jgi:hypothetical protein
MTYQEHDRAAAIRAVLTAMANPLMLASPDRHVVIELARFHKITAEELLIKAYGNARGA